MTGILKALMGQNKPNQPSRQQQAIAHALTQKRPTLDERWGNRQLSRFGQARMAEHQFQKDYRTQLGRGPVPLDYTSVADMFDGGGPGASGSTFQGAPISTILNGAGVQPRENQTMRYLASQPGAEHLVQGVQRGEISMGDAVRALSKSKPQDTRAVTGQTAAALGLDPNQRHEVSKAGMNDMLMGGGGSTTLMGGGGDDRMKGALAGAAQQFDPMGNRVAENDISKREIGARDNLHQLLMIQQELSENPGVLDDVHTMTGRMQKSWHAMRDGSGIDALELSPEQQEQLSNSTAYRQRLTTALNAYIKATTGATVGQGQETTRLKAAMPNEDDTPAQLMAKLTGAIENARMDVARYNMMRTTGAGEAPTDAQLRNHLKAVGKAYLEEALRSGLGPNDARLQASQRLSEEYGF